MKAILEFNLPEEEGEHQLAIDASKWSGVLWDLDKYLRNKAKYTDEKIDPAELRTEIYNLMQERNLVFPE